MRLIGIVNIIVGDVVADESLAPGGGFSHTVLVVDDNPSILALVGHIVEDESDLRLVTAQGFDEALGLAKEQFFDGVLLDINLGEARTGEDLLYALRALPAYREVPILAFTAYDFDRAHFLEVGFTEYLEKPFTTETLIEILDLL